jgi:competence protein ComEA
MPALTRSQLLLYGALAIALLLLGARWIRSADASEAPAAGYHAQDTGGGVGIKASGGEDVVVHIAGAVRSPGVYRLPAGSRVTDAVDRAGGPAASADVNAINLAARIADGQQVVVPAEVKAGVGGAAVSESDPEGPISLGTATLEDLDTIEGIGPVTAQNILDFRDEHGGVSSIDDLDQVPGIGPATMEALRARLQP